MKKIKDVIDDFVSILKYYDSIINIFAEIS